MLSKTCPGFVPGGPTPGQESYCNTFQHKICSPAHAPWRACNSHFKILVLEIACRKHFEAVATLMLDFWHENMSLKMEGKESILRWLPTSDNLLSGSHWHTLSPQRWVSPAKPEHRILGLFVTLCSPTKQPNNPSWPFFTVKYPTVRVNSVSSRSKGELWII